jgi:glutamyl-Q tRNA(Asp) synthetase
VPNGSPRAVDAVDLPGPLGTMTRPVFRFAPSPNGRLHLGHALSALLNFEMAQRTGGRFLLRLEDIDQSRCRPEYEQAIFEDLAWLGIVWEEPVRRQSQHFDVYRQTVERLDRRGLIFPAFESRAEIAALVAAEEQRASWPRDPDGVPHFPGAHAKTLSLHERMRRIGRGDPYALRLHMRVAALEAGPLDWTETGEGPSGETGQIGADPQAWGDVILARKDIPTSYHLAVVVDDAAQGVTVVVRGVDLFHATSVHRLLQRLLGLPAPIYHHHPLVRDEIGQKLSKSDAATGLFELRGAGLTPADVRRQLGLPPA